MPTKDFSSGYTATDNHGSATLVYRPKVQRGESGSPLWASVWNLPYFPISTLVNQSITYLERWKKLLIRFLIFKFVDHAKVPVQ